MIYLAQNIKYLVNLSKLTQDAFGAQFGISKNLTGQYIAGKSRPKLEVLLAMAEKYDLTLDELVTENLFGSEVKNFTEALGGLLTGNTKPIQLLKKASKKELIKIVSDHIAELEKAREEISTLKVKRKEFEDLQTAIHATHLRSAKTHDNQINMSELLEEILKAQERFSKDLEELKGNNKAK